MSVGCDFCVFTGMVIPWVSSADSPHYLSLLVHFSFIINALPTQPYTPYYTCSAFTLQSAGIGNMDYQHDMAGDIKNPGIILYVVTSKLGLFHQQGNHHEILKIGKSLTPRCQVNSYCSRGSSISRNALDSRHNEYPFSKYHFLLCVEMKIISAASTAGLLIQHVQHCYKLHLNY